MLAACGASDDSAATDAATTAAAPTEPAAATEPTEAPAAVPEASALSEGDLQALAEEFAEVFTRQDFKGGVYIAWQGLDVYSGGAGQADKTLELDNGADVVYHIASISKQFCAAAILRLCEEGKMSVIDTLGKYFPEYKKGKNITVHNLLSMQSGIPDPGRVYDGDGNEISVPDDQSPIPDGISESNSAEKNLEVLKKLVFSMDLLFEQGGRFSYSNSNYVLLALIAEKVSGMRYEDYIRTQFFEPLGMETAGFIDIYDNEDAVAAAAYRRTGAYQLLSYRGATKGCGDIMASPIDVYKWTLALHGGEVLGEEMYRKMTTVYTSNNSYAPGYGYGLMMADTEYGKMYYHSGSLPSYKSFVGYIPAIDYYIAAMSNYNCENSHGVAGVLTRTVMQKAGAAAE